MAVRPFGTGRYILSVLARKGVQKGSRVPNPRPACRKAGTAVKGGRGEVGLTGRVCWSPLEGYREG